MFPTKPVMQLRLMMKPGQDRAHRAVMGIILISLPIRHLLSGRKIVSFPAEFRNRQIIPRTGGSCWLKEPLPTEAVSVFTHLTVVCPPAFRLSRLAATSLTFRQALWVVR